MNGHVDHAGRALVSVLIRQSDESVAHKIIAWIDTGFNGELVLPQRQIDEWGLQPSGTVTATLADGSKVTLTRYACLIDWFDQTRELEVVANEGEFPLLGVGLLLGYDLHVSYRRRELTIS